MRDLIVFGLTLLTLGGCLIGMDGMERALLRLMGYIVPPPWWQKEKKS